MTTTWPGRSAGSSTSRWKAKNATAFRPPSMARWQSKPSDEIAPHHGKVLSPSVRHAPVEAAAPARAPVAPGHGDVRPGFIEEDEARGLHLSLLHHEGLPLGPNIVALSLGGPERLFFTVSPSSASARSSVRRLTRGRPCSARLWRSSSLVASGHPSTRAAKAARSSPKSFGVGPRRCSTAAAVPALRQRRLIFCTKPLLTWKRSATASSVALPRRAASRMRWRRSGEKVRVGGSGGWRKTRPPKLTSIRALL